MLSLSALTWTRAAGLAAAVLGSLWAAWAAIPPWVPPQPAWSVQVLDRRDRPLRLFPSRDGYWRLPLEPEAADPAFLRALLEIEDRRFFAHPGVDPLAAIRAATQILTHGRIHSGASTLSMQVARLLHPRPRGWWAKLRQAWDALRLERGLSKARILRLYLALAPYGGNLQGLAAASRFYFAHGPGHLRPSEIAFLLALPQAPEARRPDRHPEAARRARGRILARLAAAGLLDPRAAALADRQPLPRRRPAPLDAAQLSARLAEGYRGAAPIRTSLDRDLQRRLQGLARQVQKDLPEGDTLSLMVVDHASGEVLAHLGSGGYLKVTQLDLSRAVRSPGSTLKPFIYGLGFELGLLHPATRFLDRAPAPGGYAPANFDGRYHGVVTLAQALIHSLNTPAVAALERIGPERLVRRLARVRVGLRLPRGARPGPPLALGGAGLCLEDLAALYAALAEGGQWRPLRFVPGGPDPRRTLLSAEAAAWIDAILAQVPPPPGFGPERGIRYKTGTSYGFRDAWAIGYDHRYTVAVWVGRPDGGYHPQGGGAQRAAPVLFQAFARLPSSQPLSDMADAAWGDPPPAMGWLGAPPERRRARILYPPAQAHLRLAPGEALRLEARDGQPPYRWIVNGRPWDLTLWRPDGPGRQEIRLVDARGEGEVREIWVEERPRLPRRAQGMTVPSPDIHADKFAKPILTIRRETR